MITRSVPQPRDGTANARNPFTGSSQNVCAFRAINRFLHRSVVLVLIAIVLTACSDSPSPTHAEVVALNAATGRVLWSSDDIPRLALVGNMTVDNAAQSLTVRGITCTSAQRSKDVAVILDARTGHLRSRGPDRRTFGGGPDAEDPTTGFPILARDGDTDYEWTTSHGVPKVMAVAHREAAGDRAKFLPPQQPIWSRELPGPDHIIRRVDSLADALHQRVLYVAIATSASCVGSD